MIEEETQRADPPAADTAAPGWLSELGLRIATGLVLGVVALGLAWAGVWPFAGLALAIALILSWEWAHMIRNTAGLDLSLGISGVAMVCAAVLTAFGFAALAVAVLLIATIIVFALQFNQRPCLSAAGVLYAGLPAVAFIWLRSSGADGFNAVLFILLVVVATDTLAFVFGRLIGGPRLAPRVSPNKTWSGLLGGVGGAGLTAVAFGYAVGAEGTLSLGLLGLVMGLVAQAGDLAESALKRAFQLKDASGLLPGHGGFMDRVDGLVPVAVLLALVALFAAPKAPAAALMSGFSLVSG